MAIRDRIDAAGDLDVIVRDDAWSRLGRFRTIIEYRYDLPFVRFKAVPEFKRITGRPKNLHHIELMEAAGLT